MLSSFSAQPNKTKIRTGTTKYSLIWIKFMWFSLPFFMISSSQIWMVFIWNFSTYLCIYLFCFACASCPLTSCRRKILCEYQSFLLRWHRRNVGQLAGFVHPFLSVNNRYLENSIHNAINHGQLLCAVFFAIFRILCKYLMGFFALASMDTVPNLFICAGDLNTYVRRPFSTEAN